MGNPARKVKRRCRPGKQRTSKPAHHPSPQRKEALIGHAPAEHFIVRTQKGDPARARDAIFPLVKKSRDGSYALVGTAFFIQHQGIFVTAKHVAMDVVQRTDDAPDEIVAELYGIHTVGENSFSFRPVTTFTIHEGADVAVGLLAPMEHKVTKEPLHNHVLSLSFEPLVVGERVSTFAYPNTVIQQARREGEPTKLHLWPLFYTGEVVEYFENGRDRAMLPAPCYQTTMAIHGGASGGPVFNNEGLVCGLNSTGYPSMLDVSFISRINEVLPLGVGGIREREGAEPRKITVKEMIDMGQIILKTGVR